MPPTDSTERRTESCGRRLVDRVLAAAPNAILVVERSGRCLYVNPAGVRTVGLETAAAAGQRLAARGLPTAPLDELPGRATGAGPPTHGELHVPTPTGDRVFEYDLAPLGGEEAVVVDLREASPAPTRAPSAAPPAPVDAGTSAALDAATTASTLRQACHDLRTRLTVMLNWGQLLGRPELPTATLRQGAAAVVSSARRMSELVDVIAAVAHREAPPPAPEDHSGCG